ncbi:MAG: carbamoyl-phosphate synthase large subunit [Holophagales bacterium]|nr:carbamoyl-phosphate synthase large subunit [Holophagales bacterium]MYD24106.1 carbamoyl-phosphate synthase large subunit [Holophagales bacterium]MYI32319.1 carbamoyl-phosphate synthase large subunit [Holophagales bacterium]
MVSMKLLIANRGEIAVRIARAAAELRIPTVAVFSEDDAQSLHVSRADESAALPGAGPAAYLDGGQLLRVAAEHGCDAIHPGYGFLSENAGFARSCIDAGIRFVGPPPEALELFGDKARARDLAERQDVPVVPGVSEAVTLKQARSFFDGLPDGASMLIKAVGGGGGRGMRVVRTADEIEDAYRRATSEAGAAFDTDGVFVEQLLAAVRHVEVQVAADDSGAVRHFGDRDCSLQRRHQKLIEIAPAPALPDAVRNALCEAAVGLASAAGYRSLGTVEFLVDTGNRSEPRFYFIEANARLQVEHTVTEEVFGVDLVHLQLELARGRLLEDLGLGREDPPRARGCAVQARVNMETMTADGRVVPGGGILAAFEPPSGPGVRTDTFGYAGYQTNPRFDSLLAKVVGHTPGVELGAALARTSRALGDFRTDGIDTNTSFLRALLEHAEVQAWNVHTRFVDERLPELVEAATVVDDRPCQAGKGGDAEGRGLAGVKVDLVDPLAVLDHGKSSTPSAGLQTVEPPPVDSTPVPEGLTALRAPMQGTVLSLEAEPGQEIAPGQILFIMEAMKMEHEIRSDVGGVLRDLRAAVGDAVWEGHVLALIEEGDVAAATGDEEGEIDLDAVRPDLAEVLKRHAVTLDDARPEAVRKRRNTNQRTARENIDHLCDEGSFVEHGQLVLTPGTGLPKEEVIRKFPTDGMITGVGSINGELFPDDRSRCVVMAYDYTVLAGTQGAINHPKTDRMVELAHRWKRPVVLFAEGGGGRAGTGGKRKGGASTTKAGQGRSDETYRPLDTPTFTSFARLSGLVPIVGITSRFCFAGNAALLGCCDVIIATADSSIGMGGPALIEGGGLGVFRPEEVGPMDVQVPNGVVDIAVEDEEEAVDATRQYLSYFQGRTDDWEAPDQRLLRRIVPENRLRVYDIREVIHTLADTGSVLELRPEFGLGMVTALVRIEGRPVGILANNPEFLSGAIDSDGSDKGARFLQLCDAFDIPVLVLCDTPGMMVGPEIERTALVRHCCRLFVVGANITVPALTIVLRKAYGLGAQAMAGGDLKEPFFTVAWPTAEFGGMGLEGQVKLGFRNELAAIEDPEERRARYEELVAAAYERGSALTAGASFAVDDVIDPADSRRWIARCLDSVPPPPVRDGKKRRNVDTW